MADIRLADISHSYRDKPKNSDYVLRNVDLTFDDGRAYALLGPSGCGKTTMLNLISGLLTPTSGQLWFGDTDVTKLSVRKRNIAQVFQFPVIYDTMTVFGNLAFPLRNRGRSASDIKQRVGQIAELLSLDDILDKRAVNLPADLKQIIALGRGLVRDDVAAILFDEPLTVIDPQRKWAIRRKLRQVHETFHHTSIYVTHDQTEALTFADEVLVMHHGAILQRGSPRELFERPAHTFAGYFIGSPGMNVVPCELADDAAVVSGHRITLTDAVMHEARAKTGAFELGVRPEFVEIAAEQADGATVPVAVDSVEDHGRFRIASAALGDHKIKIKLTDDTPLAVGERAWVRFASGHLHLYCDGHIVDADEPGGVEASA